MDNKLTLESLNMEYIQWTLSYEQGRNEQDIRFGQHIHNTYDTQGFPDVFYIEGTEKAYRKLLEGINGTTLEANR